MNRLFLFSLVIVSSILFSCGAGSKDPLEASVNFTRQLDSVTAKADAIYQSVLTEINDTNYVHRYRQNLPVKADSLDLLIEYISRDFDHRNKELLLSHSREDEGRLNKLKEPALTYIQNIRSLFPPDFSDLSQCTSNADFQSIYCNTNEYFASTIMLRIYSPQELKLPQVRTMLEGSLARGKVYRQTAEDLFNKVIEYKKGITEEWNKAKEEYQKSFKTQQ